MDFEGYEFHSGKYFTYLISSSTDFIVFTMLYTNLVILEEKLYVLLWMLVQVFIVFTYILQWVDWCPIYYDSFG